MKSRNSTVGTATGYGLDGPEVGVRVPVGSRILISFGSGVHLTSYTMGSGAFSPGRKAAGK
jgi:hypothetical protein